VIAWEPREIAAKVTLKLEHLQIGGSFKVRGAINCLLAQDPAQLQRGVVTASGGNHGIGVAYAASRVGAEAVVFLPRSAPASTERRLAALGARSVRGGLAWDDAWQAALAHADQEGALAIHPFEDRLVIAGQSTVGLELFDQAPGLDAALVAVGGGGLIAGIAAWFAGRSRVIALEPALAPTLFRAREAGVPVDVQVGGIAADSLGARRVGQIAWDVTQRHVERTELLDDEAIRDAQRFLWSELKLAVEPAAALPLAALRTGLIRPRAGECVALIICGANLDPATLA
jgi:threonine dehydratase